MRQERNRQPAGAPASIGGQFATEPVPTAAVTLDQHVQGLDDDDAHEYERSVLMLPGRVGELQKIVDRANRRLERAGIDDRFTYTVTPEILRANNHSYELSRVTLNRPVIRYSDWEFTGAHVATAAGTFTSHGLRDTQVTIPTDNRCDQCGHQRRRGKLYTVRNPKTGETAQVGSNCLALFLGVKPAGLWALEFEPEAELEFVDDSAGIAAARSVEVHDGEAVLVYALRASQGGGNWVSQRNATREHESTATQVHELLKDHDKLDITADEQAQLDEVLAWVDRIPEDTEDPFRRNLKAVLTPGADGQRIVSRRHVGTAAAAVVGWANDQRKRQEAESTLQQHIGVPGERITDHGTVRVVKISGFETAYGWAEVVTFKDSKGRLLKWMSSSVPDEVTAGREYVLDRATVKKHDEWRGDKITAIIRPKLTAFDEENTQ